MRNLWLNIPACHASIFQILRILLISSLSSNFNMASETSWQVYCYCQPKLDQMSMCAIWDNHFSPRAFLRKTELSKQCNERAVRHWLSSLTTIRFDRDPCWNKKIRDYETLRPKIRDSETQRTQKKNETSWLITKASEISRSDQNFPRPRIFWVPFATPFSGNVFMILEFRGNVFMIFVLFLSILAVILQTY